MKVFIYGEYADWQKKVFWGLLDDGIEIEWGVEVPEKSDYEVLIWGVPEEKFVREAARLKKVVVPYAGIPQKTRLLLGKYPGIELHNLHHNAIPTAEMAFTLMLSAAKSIVIADNHLRKGDWTPRHEGLPNRLLYGKTALILGLGEVGKHLGRMCIGMGMKVLATRRNLTANITENGIDIFGRHELEKLLPQADYLLVTLPLTQETEGLLDRRSLELLPEGTVIVNIGRGTLIAEKALFELLQSGHIAAAGLDVWYNYPQSKEARTFTFPGNYPFQELENVVMSPHRGGAFANYDTEQLRVEHLANLLNGYFKTGTMRNLTDLKAGY